MLLNQTRQESKFQKIMLGRAADNHSVHMPPPIFEGEHSSDLTITAGLTDSDGERYSLEEAAQVIRSVLSGGRAESTYDAAHLFLAKAVERVVPDAFNLTRKLHAFILMDVAQRHGT